MSKFQKYLEVKYNETESKQMIEDLLNLETNFKDEIEIPMNEIPSDYVIINVPQIYSSFDENEENLSISSYRVINMKHLLEIAKYGLKIDCSPINEQNELFPQLMSMITNEKSKESSKTMNDLKEHFEMLTETITTDKIYETFSLKPINTDKIRTYVLNGICDIQTFDSSHSFQYEYAPGQFIEKSVEFYSLLPPNEFIKAKIKKNATEYTETLYIIEKLRQSLELKLNRTYIYSVQNINVYAFFFALYGSSQPLQNYSFPIHNSHLISNMIDLLIRTKYYKPWEESKYNKFLLNNIHGEENMLVEKLSATKGCKARYNIFRENFPSFLTYEDYINSIKPNLIEFNNKLYYFFDCNSLTKMIEIFAPMCIEFSEKYNEKNIQKSII